MRPLTLVERKGALLFENTTAADLMTPRPLTISLQAIKAAIINPVKSLRTE